MIYQSFLAAAYGVLTSMLGIDLKNPVFWIGLIYGALMAIPVNMKVRK